MKKHLLAATMALSVLAPVVAPSAASAQYHDGGYRDGGYRDGGRDYGWHGDDNGYNNGDWNPRDNYRSRRGYDRALTRDDRIYRGRDGRAYCRRNDGTTGLVVGALGGGVLGNVIGGGTLGTLLGAGGGALLGRSIDRNQVRCR